MAGEDIVWVVVIGDDGGGGGGLKFKGQRNKRNHSSTNLQPCNADQYFNDSRLQDLRFAASMSLRLFQDAGMISHGDQFRRIQVPRSCGSASLRLKRIPIC